MSPAEKNKPRELPQKKTELKGSERKPARNAVLLGPADPSQRVEVSIVLRRRPDGPPVPDFEYFAKTPAQERARLSQEEFAAKYGAAPGDIARVTDFARAHGLRVVETNAARRTVLVSGTVTQMEETFGVTLSEYRHEYTEGREREAKTETYPGREGSIHVPTELADLIVGVFGLDNRRIAKRAAAGDPPNTN